MINNGFSHSTIYTMYTLYCSQFFSFYTGLIAKTQNIYRHQLISIWEAETQHARYGPARCLIRRLVECKLVLRLVTSRWPIVHLGCVALRASVYRSCLIANSSSNRVVPIWRSQGDTRTSFRPTNLRRWHIISHLVTCSALLFAHHFFTSSEKKNKLCS